MPKTHFNTEDHHFMQRAILLAKRGHFTTSPNPRVGCVIVNGGKIVGEGYHEKAGSGHAEVNAIAQAGRLAKGATAYVTLEPCSHYGKTPPCAIGLINAGVNRVIAAMVDPNPSVSGKGLKILEAAGIITHVGLLEADAIALNPGFISLMTRKTPYVRCKLAASIDGKTAMASGESKWITSELARQDVQRLRAQSCAVISGASSVITDNAKMNVRWSELGEVKKSYLEENLRQPVRVIIDSQNRITPNLALFDSTGPVLLIRKSIEYDVNFPDYVEQIICTVKPSCSENTEEKIDLSVMLDLLARRGLNDVLIESGANLAGAFIEQSLVDELILFQAPKLIGGAGKNLLELSKIDKLAQVPQLMINDVTMIGKDIRITASFNEKNSY